MTLEDGYTQVGVGARWHTRLCARMLTYGIRMLTYGIRMLTVLTRDREIRAQEYYLFGRHVEYLRRESPDLQRPKGLYAPVLRRP